MKSDETSRVDDDFWWAALVARVLHPVQVEIVEALRWIDRPLTAVDLLEILEVNSGALRIDHHLRRLARLGAAAREDAGRARAPRERFRYRLMGRQGT